MINQFKQKINDILDIKIILIAILMVIPLFVLAQWFQDTHWQQATIVTMASLIVHHNLQTAPLWVIAHGGFIVGGFIILLLAIPVPWLFVVLCGSMAALTFRLAGWDKALRTFGNFTFIPALYLACEFNERLTGDRLQNGLHFVLYMISAMLPVLLLSTYQHYKHYDKVTTSLFRHMLRFHHRNERLTNGIAFVEPLIAVTVAVSLSALLVEKEDIAQGQRLIWSAASVITGEANTVGRKLQDRAVGAILGVPLGIALGMWTPHTVYYLDIGALCTLVTLVAFRQYVLGFGARCACVAFVITLMGEDTFIASERILNVLSGGVIGVGTFYAIHYFTQRRL